MNALDALGLACLIIAGGCALAVIFGIIERTIAALVHPKRRKH
jgi:hypothetical protein